jgi:hypothetical protein
MKKRFSVLVFGLLAVAAFAQNGAKKYVLIEHFTNSNCSNCAARNPAFYNLIGQAQYAENVHHVSVHPSFPYSSCVFYQANTAENTAWTNQYAVQGTPSIAINGAYQSPSSPILTEAKLLTYLGQTSPLALQVTESGSGNARSVNVKAKAVGDIPPGNYKIFVAILEKKVNQTTGNGESVHRDVFRKMLTAVSGDAFTPPANGQTAEFNYQFNIAANWKADEVYVLAFVKETDTKQVLNSGTRFDPALSSSPEVSTIQLQVWPNPATDEAVVSLPQAAVRSLEVFSSDGRRVSASFSAQGDFVSIPVADFAPGVYFVKVLGDKNWHVGKFVKR